MRFVVILKQIPDDSIKDEYQDVDQLNDSDKNVIKEALDLRDRYGGTVDVIGFGPLSAEDVMKETLTYGIDDAFLISDSQFADMATVTLTETYRFLSSRQRSCSLAW